MQHAADTGSAHRDAGRSFRHDAMPHCCSEVGTCADHDANRALRAVNTFVAVAPTRGTIARGRTSLPAVHECEEQADHERDHRPSPALRSAQRGCDRHGRQPQGMRAYLGADRICVPHPFGDASLTILKKDHNPGGFRVQKTLKLRVPTLNFRVFVRFLWFQVGATGTCTDPNPKLKNNL